MPETLLTLRKNLHLPVPPETAFELFTAAIGTWWPLELHSLSASEGRAPLGLSMERRPGGRLLERRHDGSVADWATLTDWQPPGRLAMDWYVGRARANATAITVLFEAGDPESTRLTLIHGGFERLGPAGEAAAANYDECWDLVLGERFRQACEGD